jgi:hypothetical protein
MREIKMGRPTKDGIHEVERTETMRWLGMVRAQNPHLTLAEIELKIFPTDVNSGNEPGYKIGRYLNGRRAMRFDDLKLAVQKARKHGLLYKLKSIGNQFDDLIDSASTARPTKEIAEFNKSLQKHFLASIRLHEAWSEFVATAKNLPVDFFVEKDQGKHANGLNEIDEKDFAIRVPVALFHRGRFFAYPDKSGAKVVQSKPKAKVNETKSKSKKSI